ncbi:hypothetical protein B0H14DRAFT_2560407 [Mycena olivaceomarginata]|nr:hypothetical protein B0H14DRAFT_2560407 [Mycena olivaceomarginata]
MTYEWYQDTFTPPASMAPPPTLNATSAAPIAPNDEPSAPAVPAAPFTHLPPNSQQKKGETIQAFFIRRSEGNCKKMAKRELCRMPADAHRELEHAQKGGVPSKGHCFPLEKVRWALHLPTSNVR